MLFTVLTHQTCAVYCMDALILCSIQHGYIKLTQFTPYCKQRRFDVQYCNQCQFDGQYRNQDRFDRHVLTSVLIAEKTLPGTFVKIHIIHDH
jgi:hypothetical protein